MIRTLLASAVAVVVSLGAASAATLSFTPTPLPFLSPDATLISGTLANNVTASEGGVRLSPWANDSGPFSSVSGSAEYVFDSLSTYFSLVWGSPDDYNTLTFYDDMGEVDSVLGTEILGFNNGGNVPNSLVTIITDFAFNRVVFSSVNGDGSPRAAFEWARVTNVAPVPLPAGGLLLLGGLGAIAALRRRKSV